MNDVTSPVTTKSLPDFVVGSWTDICWSDGEVSVADSGTVCALCCALIEVSTGPPAGLF